MKRSRLLAPIAAAYVLVCAPYFASAALQLERQKPVYMDADKLGYDQQNAIVVALGNVRVVQGQSTLYADRITYYQQQNVVRAKGNIRVQDAKSGETYYADQVQLKDDLMQGVIANFRVRLADNSQFAAREAERIDQQTIKLRKAVYSPCKICEGEDPFWQMKADNVTIDDKEQRVTYDDVTLEMLGIPVMYTPYFSHPTPDADSKSGFLIPTYEQNSNLGLTAQIPYYFAIAPDRDATLTPFFTSKEGLVMIGEYRQLFDSGHLKLEGSMTYPNERDDFGVKLSDHEFRGHLYAEGKTALNEQWDAGFNLRRASDDTYLRRYGFGSPRSLTSRLYSEGRYGRSYALIEGLSFQGLDARDDPATEPFVMPLAEGYYESEAGLLGIKGLRQYASLSTQIIHRQEEANSRRLSLIHGGKLPITTSGGHLLDVTLQNRMDVYSVENLPQMRSAGGTIDSEQTRYVPTAAVKWRYPLINRSASGQSSVTIEPTVLAIARPSGGNRDKIPNEDNVIVEFSEANLFEINPFPGYDTVDEGSRIAYGLGGHWWLGDTKSVFFNVGQSVSFDSETPFPYNDDPGEHLSDYVGRMSFHYDPFELHYRFRLDQENLGFNNQSVGLRFAYSPIRLDLDYVTFKDDAFLDTREEIATTAALDVTEEWTLQGYVRRDLQRNQMLYAGGGAVYHNECFTLDAAFSRAFVEDRDLRQDTVFSLRLAFRNLTEL